MPVTPRPRRIVQTHVDLGDPHRCDDDAATVRLRRLRFTTLVAPAPDGGHRQALASAWRVDAAARRWRFRLRPEARAHDGASLGARDVIASLERARDPAVGGALGTAGVFAHYLEGVRFTAERDADGAELLSLATPRPFADLLDLLVDLPVLRVAALGRDGAAQLGSGPYRLASNAPGRIELVRWDDALASHVDDTVPVGCERLTIRAQPDPAERVAALLAGEADVATEIPSRLAHALDGDHRVRVQRRPGGAAVVAFFHLDPARPSPVHDVRVRRALQLATDVRTLVRELHQGYATPLSGPFPAPHLGLDPAAAPPPFDSSRARALLVEAGHGDGLTLTFDVPERLPDEAPALVALLARQWAAIGVRLEVRRHADREGYAWMVRERRYGDLCLFDSSPASSYRVLREKFHGGHAGPWWQGWSDPAVDAAIDAGAAEPDAARRAEHYRRAVARIVAASVWLLLYAPERLWLEASASGEAAR